MGRLRSFSVLFVGVTPNRTSVPRPKNATGGHSSHVEAVPARPDRCWRRQASTAGSSVEYVPWMLLSQAAGSSSKSLEYVVIGW